MNRKVVAGAICIGTGVIVATIGYFGVSKETVVAFQLPYFASAAVGALLLFGAGATLLISAQIETDGRRAAEIETAVRMLGDEIGKLSDALTPQRGTDLHVVRGKRA
jgi:hypothetical protein